MPLIIGTTPYSQWQRLNTLIAELGGQFQELPFPQSISEDATYLLLHSRPEYAIALAMEEGCNPAFALEQWRTAAEQLFSFYKQHRRQAAMVDLMAAARHPEAMLNWLTKYHRAFYDLPVLEQATLSGIDGDIPGPKEHYLLLASQLVAQAPDLTTLLNQLEASSIPLDESRYAPPSLDMASLYQWITQQKDLFQEKMLVINQLHKVQEELEIQYLDARSYQKEAALLRAEKEQLKKELEDKQILLLDDTRKEGAADGLYTDLVKRIEQYRAAQDSLEGQLRSKELALESSNSELKKNLQVVDELQAELLALREEKSGLLNTLKENQQGNSAAEIALVREKFEKEIENLKVEASKMAEALAEKERQLKEFRDVQADLKEENDLILRQLFKVQEELERYYLEGKEQKRKLRAQSEILSFLSNDKKSLRKKNRQISEERNKYKALLQRAIVVLRKNRKKHSLFKAATSRVRMIRRRNRQIAEHVRLVSTSQFFDEQWYLLHNPDVVASYPSAAEHYVRHGGNEGRAPGPGFCSHKYLEQNPDVAESKLNPLVHYLLYGKAERRKLPTP